MGKKKGKEKFCPECGEPIEENKFCTECGYKLVITETIEDKEGHIKKAQEIIESESPIGIPDNLSLMPGEKLLEKHLDFYVSNKRLIQHKNKIFGSDTVDYHYRHIKGLKEHKKRPFIKAGLLIGILSILLASFNLMFFIIGVIFIVLAFWFETEHLEVIHMDGGNIVIPNLKSESGQKIANVLRTQLYNK